MTRIHTIVTHLKAHLDEIVAILFLRWFGEELFPGARTAKVIYWNAGRSTPDGRCAEEWEQDGCLLVGVGGSRFDEHGRGENGDDCAATLVARALGIAEDPVFKRILRYITQCDRRAAGSTYDIASTIKFLHEHFPDKPEQIMNWVEVWLRVHCEEQRAFLAAGEDYRRAARDELTGPAGKLIVVTVESDNPRLHKYARSEYGDMADLIIQRNSRGNVQIFSNLRSELRLDDVVRMLRIEERRAGKVRGSVAWRELAEPGSEMAGWFFHENRAMILNGSLTAPDVTPTRLSLPKIQWIVRTALNPDEFERDHAARCAEGVCTAWEKRCPWYDYGLSRCRTIRYRERVGREGQ